TGPVALQLGLLAAALGRGDDAAAHLDDAARRCDRLGAQLLAARARAERARVLATRDHPATGEGDNADGNLFRRDGDVWTVAFNGELARATGLGGRRRRLGDAAERARTTVTARIRDAIGRIERAHPELGRHLRASIVTGARCAYRPAETVRWSVSQS